MGSSVGKQNKEARKRSSSISHKTSDSKLQMHSELNPEQLDTNSWTTQKKLIVPGRKYSEAIRDEKFPPMKKTSTNSAVSRSTQSSNGSNKILSEKNYFASQQISSAERRSQKHLGYRQIMLERFAEANQHLPEVDLDDVSVQTKGLST